MSYESVQRELIASLAPHIRAAFVRELERSAEAARERGDEE